MMNSTILISMGMSLISLSAGMFLLAKANKDALGLLYKIMAWFIIICSLLHMACGAMHCMMGFYGKHMQYEMMMHDKKDEKMKMHFMEDGTGMGMWRHHGYGEEHQYGGMNGCCNGTGGDDRKDVEDKYWKKCYEQLKDSCGKKQNFKKAK